MQISGQTLRALRRARGETQAGFAAFLNRQLSRNYAKATISRWENGTEDIPRNVMSLLMSSTQNIKTVVVAVANQKGGVGKTTTAVNLGYALAKAGYKTLLVDADPQANATVHVGFDPVEFSLGSKTLYHALRKNGVPLNQIILPASDKVPLFLAPSSLDLSAADTELSAQPGSSLIMREKMEPLQGDYAFVIIDCPPHLGILTINALSAADLVLIPTQTEALSLMGIPLLLDTIETIQRRGTPNLRVFGLLPTMYSARLTQDKATLADMQRVYGERFRIFPEILRTTLYPQAAAAGKVTLEAAPQTLGIQAYEDLAAELIAVTVKEQMEPAHG